MQNQENPLLFTEAVNSAQNIKRIDSKDNWKENNLKFGTNNIYGETGHKT